MKNHEWKIIKITALTLPYTLSLSITYRIEFEKKAFQGNYTQLVNQVSDTSDVLFSSSIPHYTQEDKNLVHIFLKDLAE